jgi:hypothetical protein
VGQRGLRRDADATQSQTQSATQASRPSPSPRLLSRPTRPAAALLDAFHRQPCAPKSFLMCLLSRSCGSQFFSAFREPRPQERLFCRTGLRPLTPLKSVPSSPGANAPGLAAFIRLGTRKSGLRDVRPLHAALNTDPRQAPPRRLRGSGCFVSAMLAGTRCCEAACGLRASLLGDAQTSFSQEGASAFGTAITPVAAGSCVVL